MDNGSPERGQTPRGGTPVDAVAFVTEKNKKLTELSTRQKRENELLAQQVRPCVP